ncbi:MAG: minor capsid protein [Myxococcota bacterium]
MAAIDLLLERRRLRKELPRRVPPPQDPSGPRLRYWRALRTLVARVREATIEELEPALERLAEDQREDGVRTDESVFEALMAALDRLGARIIDIERDFQQAGAVEQTVDAIKSQSRRDIARRIGINVGDVTTGPQVDAFLEQNRELIKSLAEEPARQVQALVREGLGEGRRVERLRDEIMERFNVAESRAQLIARTETAKLKAQIDAERVKRIGITHYIWRTVGDARVRDEHAAVDGKRFSYDSPPSSVGAHPGEEPNCRCWAEPDTSAIFAEGEAEQDVIEAGGAEAA